MKRNAGELQPANKFVSQIKKEFKSGNCSVKPPALLKDYQGIREKGRSFLVCNTRGCPGGRLYTPPIHPYGMRMRIRRTHRTSAGWYVSRQKGK